MEAEIITIGTELLLGEIVDTNTRTIARALRDIGLDLFRTTTVGDNVERIAQVVSESAARAQIVITTGGLGPTVDDPTREGIAQAFNRPLEFHSELWSEIEERYGRYGSEPSENSKQMAFIPKDAVPISNPVGTAPAFIVETSESAVIALPGVPAEMSYLLEKLVIPYIKKRLNLSGILRSRILRTAGVGESILDERIEDLEKLNNPTVGLSAHPGRVDIRITAKGNSKLEVHEMLRKMEATLRQRVGEHIYGTDEETLEGVVLKQLRIRGWRLVVVEGGTEGALSSALLGDDDTFRGGFVMPDGVSLEELGDALKRAMDRRDVQVGIGLLIIPEVDLHRISFVIDTPDEDLTKTRGYGGAPINAPLWGVSHSLNALRTTLS
ncbi:MAG: CinA family nicotinamide mononucleotide deamidase-related protein [Anaerolineales bacterium]|nr:CinA family nicotinamide mononucleotide deamidase-related protein [Anaerolineales bacterium]